MPFTLAHPAAVMPLRRLKSLPTAALIVGSMTPDVPYYAPGRIYSLLRDTHSLYGSFVLCIPLGLFVIAFALLMRRPLTALMTERARWVSLRAAERFAARPINWLFAIPALLIGSWTHIVWDSFTHPGTWMVRRVDVLSEQISVFGLYTGEVSHVLQYASSVIGLAVLGYWYAQVAAEAPPEVRALSGSGSRARWLILSLVAVAAAVVGTLVVRLHHHDLTFYGMAYLLLTRTLAWFVLLYVMAGTLMSLSGRTQPQLQS